MAALGRQFLTVNSILLPETSSFDIDFETIEKEFQTEDGHDKSIIVRSGKLVFNCAWEVADDTLKTNAESICRHRTVSVVFNGQTYTCRARELKESMVRYSNRYSGSKGLWNISFKLKEI